VSNQSMAMSLPTLGRMVAGNLLIVSGMGLLAAWTDYFWVLMLPLKGVVPIDLWDISPLPLAIAAILTGIQPAPALPRYCFKKVKANLVTCLHASYKRCLVIAFVAGGLIEFVLWLLGYVMSMLSRVTIWLDRLQEPGERIGLFVFWHTFKPPNHPWSTLIGVVCGFAVLIAMWSITLALLWSARFLTVTRKSQ
jgi:hypothetical protein